MSDKPDPASTPAAQQQHNPPSLPNSPHPKRVKTSDLVNNPTTILPSMSTQQHLGTEAASTPTPTSIPSNTIHSPSTEQPSLPPVSSLLPPISSNPHMHNGLPIVGNGNMSMPIHSMLQQPPVLPTAAPPLLIQKLSPDATKPTRGSAFAAGYDLYASAPLTLKAKSKGLISTGLAIAVPAGTYGRVAPRSGLASKHFLDTGAGVIDADYRGEVKVLMFNFSDVDYEVKKGERVAQLVLERIVTPEVVEVQELEASVRGVGGFGSTGVL